MYIFYPEFTWLFIYSSCLLMFIVHSIFNRFFKQDLIGIVAIIFSIIQSLPVDLIQNFSEKNATTIQEILIFLISLCLISHKYLKKLLFYIFALAIYFSLLTVAHISHSQNFFVPIASFVLIIALFQAHKFLPNNASTKNNKYFIVIFLILTQFLLENAGNNIFFLALYLLFAFVLSCKAYFDKSYHHKVFYTFFAFFVLIISHIFTQHYVKDVIEYAILYSIIAYFLYSTIGVQFKKSITLTVAIQTVIILLQVCFVIFNPSYFLLAKLETQTFQTPLLHLLSMFSFFAISLSIFQIIWQTIKKPRTKKDSHIARTIYTTIVLLILIIVQIIHNILYEISDIVYAMTFVSFFIQICYAILTFCLLFFGKICYQKLQKKPLDLHFFHSFSKKATEFFAKFKPTNLPDFSLYFLQENVTTAHKAVLLIMPVFLAFYLAIALFY